MDKRVQTLIYGKHQECSDIASLLHSLPLRKDKEYEIQYVHTWEDFQLRLVERNPSLAIVVADGAAGMEGVYLVKRTRPTTPVFWFSDDYNFGVQSHRLECDYFGVKPVTEEKMENAFRRCSYVGVQC